MKAWKNLLAALSLGLLLAASQGAAAAEAKPATRNLVVSKYVQAREDMRQLWLGHIFWDRNYVVATADNNPGARDVADKQARDNIQQLAGAFQTYYGADAAKKLGDLLAEHFNGLKDYTNATLPTPDAAKQDAARKRLDNNVKDLAEFLSKANPNLPVDTLRNMLSTHVAQHIAAVDAVQKKDFNQEAGIWEQMEKHIYEISDTLTQAIAKQFPGKF